MLCLNWSTGGPTDGIDNWMQQVKNYKVPSGEKLPDSVKVAVLLKTVNEPLRTQQRMKVGARATEDDMINMIEDYSRLSKSWPHSSNTSTKSTTGYYGDSFGDPVDVGDVGINALFQPKGKAGKGKGKEGKGRRDSGHEENKKGKAKAQKGDAKNFNGKGADKDITCYLCREQAHRTKQCPQRIIRAVDTNDNESACASSASASACRSMGTGRSMASISRIGAGTPTIDELYSDDDSEPAPVFMV